MHRRIQCSNRKKNSSKIINSLRVTGRWCILWVGTQTQWDSVRQNIPFETLRPCKYNTVKMKPSLHRSTSSSDFCVPSGPQILVVRGEKWIDSGRRLRQPTLKPQVELCVLEQAVIYWKNIWETLEGLGWKKPVSLLDYRVPFMKSLFLGARIIQSVMERLR